MWICSWSPLPYWSVRILAPLAGYSVRRYLLATFLGRFPRFWFFAALGGLPVPSSVFVPVMVLAIGGALGVVLAPDLFRAALLLIVVFLAVAGFFILLSAEFLAVVQVLIYAGAIAILIIFAIMLTRDVQRGNLANRLQIPVATIAALLLAALVVVAVETGEESQENDQ